jgi:hypothetical protein
MGVVVVLCVADIPDELEAGIDLGLREESSAVSIGGGTICAIPQVHTSDTEDRGRAAVKVCKFIV